jgi:quinol monooxygenase YgiN
MLILNVKISICSENKANFIETVAHLIEPLSVEEGCIECMLLEDILNQNNMHFIVTLNNGNAMRRLINNSNFKSLLIILEMANEKPQVSLHNVLNNITVESMVELLELNG